MKHLNCKAFQAPLFILALALSLASCSQQKHVLLQPKIEPTTVAAKAPAPEAPVGVAPQEPNEALPQVSPEAIATTAAKLPSVLLKPKAKQPKEEGETKVKKAWNKVEDIGHALAPAVLPNFVKKKTELDNNLKLAIVFFVVAILLGVFADRNRYLHALAAVFFIIGIVFLLLWILSL